MMGAGSRPECEDILHRLLIEAAVDCAIHVIDSDGFVTSWNAGAQRLLGYAAADIIGRRFSILYSEDDQAAGLPRLALATALKDGRYEAEGWRLRKDGGRFWARVLIQSIPGIGDAPGGFAEITRDLTEKKAAGDRLPQATRNLELALQSMPQGFAFYDADEKLVFANEMYADMFGVRRGLVRPGMTFYEVILAMMTDRNLHPDPEEKARRFYMKLRAGSGRGERTNLVIEYARSCFVSIETQMMADGSWVSVFKDVTEQRRAEEALHDSEQRYREVFDNSSDCIFVVEVTPEQRFKLERLNPMTQRMLSLTDEAARGRFIEDVIPLGVARSLISHFEECLKAEAQIRYEAAAELSSGARQFETTLIPVRGQDGAIRRLIGIARDITEERQLNQVRAEREGYFQALVENSPDAIVRYDRDCRRIYANPAHARSSGIHSTVGIGKTPAELSAFGPKLAASFQACIERVVATGDPEEINVDFAVDGEEKHFSIRATAERDVDGAIVSVLTVARDMSRRIKAERQLQQREREYRTLVENSPDFISRYDREGRRLYVNSAMRRELGIAASPVGEAFTKATAVVDPGPFAAKIRAVLDHGATQEVETAYRSVDGRNEWGLVRFAPEFDEQGAVVSVLAVGRNITELVESRDKINRLAFYDALTDLPNRALLHEHVRKLIAGAGKTGAAFGFMMLDLDRFKEVNDTLGHAAGDMLLCEVAQRLRRCLRGQDMVARLGGDEFAILMPNLPDKKKLAAAAARILRALAAPVHLANREIAISASIGIARYPADSEDFLDIVKSADAAMYKAKSTGRNNCQFYDAEMMARAIERMMIEATLRKALSRDELELYYQPQVLMPSGRIIGAEALLRWRHPDLGFLTPDRFISVAEETGLIVEIGRWVIETACRAAVAWNGDRAEPIMVSANVSPRQVTHNDLVAVVAKALAATGCKPQWLCLEITESLLLEDKHNARTTLDGLKQLGLSIAIDDFGTGHSALSYLSDFPIDVLKIDRSFVRDIGADHRKTELMKAIIGIAGALDLKLVAEGVETERQSAILQESGCGIAQGYLYGKPTPRDIFTHVLAPQQGEKRFA